MHGNSAYKTLSATDTFGSQPHRSLSFINEVTGYQGGANFEPGRSTLLFDGELYDWFGRRVPVSDNIKRIVEPLGYEYVNLRPIRRIDRFLVELHSGAFAVVHLTVRSFSHADAIRDFTLFELLNFIADLEFQLVYHDSDPCFSTPESARAAVSIV